MLVRLWFSICALAAVLLFVFGAGIAAIYIGEGIFSDRRMQWGETLGFGSIGFFGPLLCLFIYRWGLWVAGAPSRG